MSHATARGADGSTSRKAGVARLHWGCGKHPAPGWVNSDRKERPGIDVCCDIRDGLPAADETFDYAFSAHALQELPYPDLVPVLRELRRVLKPDGVLRLVLPDVDRGIDAYRRGERDYFLIPDEDVGSLGGKFVVHMLWYGYSRTLFTKDFAEELLRKAEFRAVHHCSYRVTHSPYPEIVELDDREQESLFIEAVR
jgi:SAM-dependent methyltransferase